MITHKWGADAMSPCGLSVALAYSTNDIAFTGQWHEVDCPACLDPKNHAAAKSRTSGTNRNDALTSILDSIKWNLVNSRHAHEHNNHELGAQYSASALSSLQETINALNGR